MADGTQIEQLQNRLGCRGMGEVKEVACGSIVFIVK